LHVTLAEMLHRQGRAIGSRWRHQQMYVVGHQYICMNCTTVLLRLLVQCIQIKSIILVGVKTGRPIVASLYDMPSYPCYCQSRSTRHDENSFFIELIVVCPRFSFYAYPTYFLYLWKPGTTKPGTGHDYSSTTATGRPAFPRTARRPSASSTSSANREFPRT